MIQEDKTFVEHQYITSYMVDGSMKLTPTFLWDLLQETAVNHADALGVGWEVLNKQQQFWALSRMDVQILKMPKWKETVKITTFEKKHQHLIQPRDHIITNAEGEPLVLATSNWVLLNHEGKPEMLSQYDHFLQEVPDRHAIEKPASRLRQGIALEGATFKPVVYSNIDMNQHANNAAYITWIMDNFSYEFHRSHDMNLLTINYIQQTRTDDSYAVMKQETAPGDFLCSIYSQKENIEVCRVRTVWTENR